MSKTVPPTVIRSSSLTAAMLAEHQERLKHELEERMATINGMSEEDKTKELERLLANAMVHERKALEAKQSRDQDAVSAASTRSSRASHASNSSWRRMKFSTRRKKCAFKWQLTRKHLTQYPTHPAREARNRNLCMWPLLGVPCERRLNPDSATCCHRRHLDGSRLTAFFAGALEALKETDLVLGDDHVSAKCDRMCTSLRLANPRPCRNKHKCRCNHSEAGLTRHYERCVKVSEEVEEELRRRRRLQQEAKASTSTPATASATAKSAKASATAKPTALSGRSTEEGNDNLAILSPSSAS